MKCVCKRARCAAAIAAAFIFFMATGCGMAPADPPAVQFSPGTVQATQHPLVARYSLTSPVSANVTIEFGRDTNYGMQTWSRTAAAGATVDILVAGMRPFTTYHMRARVEYSGGTYLDADHTFTTSGPDAASLPQAVVTRSGASAARGVELLDMTLPNGRLEAEVLDLDGNLIWYYAFDPSLGFPFPIRPMPNGDMAVTLGTQRLREIDLTGATVRELTVDAMNQRLSAAGLPLTVTAFHHDVLPLNNGHLVLICEEQQPAPGTTTMIRGDALVDLDASFTPVWTWSSFGHLDTARHPMDVVDWTHGNGLAYTPSDGALLLSMRNQHWILKIDYANGTGSGAVLWRLGDGGDFTLANGTEFDWFYGQHFPTLIASDTPGTIALAMFDNRAINQDGSACATDTGTCFSRPLIVDLDERNRTATIAWQDRLPWYSLWGGSVIANASTVEFDVPNPFPNNASIVEEVDRATLAPAWRLDITGQLAYRAYRIPSLYPGVQW